MASAAVTVSNGTALSNAANLVNKEFPVGLYLSGTWTAAGLSFAVSDDNVTFAALRDRNGAEITIAEPSGGFGGQYVALDPSWFAGALYLKVRSGTVGTPVNQGADRILTIVTLPARQVSGAGGVGAVQVSTATQKVNAGFMAAGQTAKSYVGKQATSTSATTTVTLETVTTGKTFYITDVYIGTDSASGAATTLDTRLQAAGTDIFRAGVHTLAPITLPGIETQLYATSGQVVTLLLPQTSGGVVNVWFLIQGFEQ
jgi:hypothetical protein